MIGSVWDEHVVQEVWPSFDRQMNRFVPRNRDVILHSKYTHQAGTYRRHVESRHHLGRAGTAAAVGLREEGRRPDGRFLDTA